MSPLLVLAALVLSVIALRRTNLVRELRRDLERLERQVAELRELLRSAIARPEAPEAAPAEAAREEDIVPSPIESPAGERPPDFAEAAPPAEEPERWIEPADDVPPGGAGEEPPWTGPPRPSIDWERFVGVQGAAILGGIVLALAGLLFFRYSIEHGLISPRLRVIVGTLVGLGCLVVPQTRYGRGYADAANAVTGAGMVILYASFWAASSLYELIGFGAAFFLMGLVTAAGCLLALRRESLLVAMLGLVGGFATPFLVSTGSDRPIGLFGYLLILDVALIAVARRRGWPLLALASLVATVLYQAFWIGFRMGPDRLTLGLAILGIFALVFAAGGRSLADEKRREWAVMQAAGILLPFAFGIYLAGTARFGEHLYPVALLLFLLCGAASWIGRGQDRSWIPLGAASASVAVFGAWALGRRPEGALVWETAACALGIAGLFHVLVERDRARGEVTDSSPPAIAAAGGLLVVLILGGIASRETSPWAWLAAWLVQTAFLVRHGTFDGREVLQPLAWTTLGLGMSFFHIFHHGEVLLRLLPLWLGVIVAVAVGAQASAIVQHRALPASTWQRAERGAVLFALVLAFFVGPLAERYSLAPALFLGTTLGLGFLGALAATRLDAGIAYAACGTVTAFTHWIWTTQGWVDAAVAPGALAVEAGAVLLFTAWPFVAAPAFRADRFAWYTAALAAPAWFMPLRRLFELRFGDDWIGVLPLLLATVSLGALSRVRHLWPADDPRRKSALAWFAAVALGFVSVAIPLQLEKEWITIGWALEGVAVIVLWRRLDHPGLKYFGVALLLAATLRLVANEAVLGYYPRPSWRIVNWLFYTYLVPAAALFTAASLLARDEIDHATPWEKQRIYAKGQPLGAVACGLAGIIIVFVWINLAIADWFSTGPYITLSFQRVPARDLTTSIAWAVYALVLLAFGMARGSSGLRWVSLAFLLITIFKVFLYDLGELRDLFRVMSLLGLAVSLILVSLAYQRFVFRKLAPEEK